jgi:ATP-dependent DNA helicase RecG
VPFWYSGAILLGDGTQRKIASASLQHQMKTLSPSSFQDRDSHANERKFMQVAIDEMQKSRSEHTEKSDPLVGAVLVGTDGTQLGTAHRGGLRVGDHAEFTLIERGLGSTNLEGSTLYVTLEPCTERAAPKKPCAERIVNARVGRVFIGMTDPNPDITGRGIQYLLDHRVNVRFFDVDLAADIKKANDSFVTYWTNYKGPPAPQQEFEGASTTELDVVSHVGLEALSSDAILRYLRQRKIYVSVASDELRTLFKNLQYIAEVDGRLAPTVAGVVLFASSPGDILPQCRISIEAVRDNRTVQADFSGPLIFFRDHLDDFVKRHFKYFTEVRGLDRVSDPEYPFEAVREAAFNAVLHRDYKAGARVHISLTDETFVVRSPGSLLEPLSLTALQEFNAPQYSRNPHIAVALYQLGWVEEKASGLRRMRDAMLAIGLPKPSFAHEGGYLIVTLRADRIAKRQPGLSSEQLADLSAPELKIIDFISRKGSATARQCASTLRVDVTTARDYLRRLIAKNLVVRLGSGPKIIYSLAGSVAPDHRK